MIVFHDYDPQHPFSVTGEVQTIANNKITLNYAPLKGSVTISGFTEVTTGDELKSGEYCINYDEANAYRNADQKVYFGGNVDGQNVTIDYMGVSTLIKARDLNEIRQFIETGAKHMVDSSINTHDRSPHAHADMRELISRIIKLMGDIRYGVEFASDAEIAEMLDIYFPGGVPSPQLGSMVADDDLADEMLDAFFPGDVEQVGMPDVFEGAVASDDEFEAMLDETLPINS